MPGHSANATVVGRSPNTSGTSISNRLLYMSIPGIVVYMTGPRGESTPIIDLSDDPLVPPAKESNA
ncbi:hypothetical protein SAMN04487783_2111 [Agrococcus baldri]|uniref:Uncharacterized protein n=1 Tax=Agrococcus baldri TaxID=153730 RepID=A0AA94HNR9_9MICO|nr:hypothetical protein SAMN04487783_2111 [Agrococcus baldri]